MLTNPRRTLVAETLRFIALIAEPAKELVCDRISSSRAISCTDSSPCGDSLRLPQMRSPLIHCARSLLTRQRQCGRQCAGGGLAGTSRPSNCAVKFAVWMKQDLEVRGSRHSASD